MTSADPGSQYRALQPPDNDGGLADAGAVVSALLPLARRAGAARPRVVVIIDDNVSMLVWQETVSTLLALLDARDSFAGVTERRLRTDAVHPRDVVVTGQTPDPERVLTRTNRRLVLILTDGVAAGWHQDAVGPRLWRWAQRHSLVLIQLLPQHLWYRTGVQPERMRLRATVAAATNAEISWQRRESGWSRLLAGLDHPTSPDAIPVPVLSPRWLPAWTRMIADPATGWANLPAIMVGSSPDPNSVTGPGDGDTAVPEPPPDARQQVRGFTSWATPTAVTLATHLAAAPLTLPMIHELQRALVPSSDASHLSEIVNSGLLDRVAPPAATEEPGKVTFEFRPGVRAALLAVARRADTARVLRLVEGYLGPVVPAVRGLSEVLNDPDHGPDRLVTPETARFVRVEQAALRALSGRYLARSRELDERLRAEDVETADSGASPVDALPETMVEPATGTIAREPGGTAVASHTAVEETVQKAEIQTAPAQVPAIWGNVPPRNPNFTGREELLAQLRDQMQAGTTAVLPQALRGMGGVGKSQLAVEYVYRYQEGYELVWWIPAERVPQAKQALAELGQRMGLPVGPHVNAALPVVLDALRVGRPHANWLLVFDNAESPDALRECIPNGGPGAILVTSRNSRWGVVANTLEVDVFKREESVQLLRRRRPEIEAQAADRLARALGDLPLAIEQAAAWLAETGMPAEEYLRLFEEKRTDLLAVSAPVDYQLPVAAAWNVSLDQLAQRSPAALRLLQVCSFLASEPIPRSLLGGAHSPDIHPDLNDTMRDPMRLNRAIREINRYALAKINYRDNSIHMHRLIQAVLIDRLPREEQVEMRRSAHLLLASSDPNDPPTPRSWPTYAELYPHVMASDAVHSNHPWVQRLVENEARYLYWWGDHESARELAQNAYRHRVAELGPEAASTLSVGRWFAYMLFLTGRYSEAARVNAELLASHERTSDEDTEGLLDAIGAIAADQRVAGRFHDAMQTASDVYERHVRALGDDDPATLEAANNLAVSMRLVGDFTQALKIDEDTVRRRRVLLGEDHQQTMLSIQSAIIDRRELGEYVVAQARQQQVVDRLKRLVDPTHPVTLRAMTWLAGAMRKAGDHTGARDLSSEARTSFARRYGEDHPDTILATLEVAINMRANGEFETAAELSEEVHKRFRSLLGEDHPHTVAASLNGAVAERLRGNLEIARRLDERGLEVLSGNLGERHPLTLACAVNLASDYYAQGQCAEAYELDLATAERLGEVWGVDHPTTLACRGNLAVDLTALGRRDEAHEVHAETVARFSRTLGDKHPATLVAADLTVRADCDLDPMPL